MKKIYVLIILFLLSFGVSESWGQNLTGKWTNGELLSNNSGSGDFSEYYLDLVQNNQKITGTMYEKREDLFALYELEGTFDGKELYFKTTKIIKRNGSWCHENVSYSFNFDKGKYILEGGLIPGYYKCEPNGNIVYFGSYKYRFEKNKGIVIISPTTGTSIETNKDFDIDFFNQDGSIATSYDVELYAIGGSIPLYTKRISTLVQDYITYKIPDYIQSGEYELRITSKTSQEVSGSVKIKVVGKTIKKQAFKSGVTIVTHGFSLFGGFPQWCNEFANAIASKTKENYSIYKNNTKTSEWEYLKGKAIPDENTEIILLYDWSDASNAGTFGGTVVPSIDILNWNSFGLAKVSTAGTGYLEAAADNLFALLASPTGSLRGRNLLFKGAEPIPIHLIGHSRGAILMLQLCHRLAYFFPNYKVEHLTTLDPHPATPMGDIYRDQEGTFASLPCIKGNAKGCKVRAGCQSVESAELLIPENVNKVDNYYRDDDTYEDYASGKIDYGNLSSTLMYFAMLPYGLKISQMLKNPFSLYMSEYNGIPFDNDIVNVKLNNNKIQLSSGIAGGAHSGVHAWYFGTIDNQSSDDKDGILIPTDWYGVVQGKVLKRENTGYYYSRIGGGFNELPLAKRNGTLEKMNEQLTQRPRFDSYANRPMTTLGVVNGNFEYANDSGWWQNGGDMKFDYTLDGNTSITTIDGKGGNNTKGMWIGGINGLNKYTATHSYLYFPKNAKYLKMDLFYDKTLLSIGGTEKFIVRFKFVDGSTKSSEPFNPISGNGDFGTFSFEIPKQDIGGWFSLEYKSENTQAVNKYIKIDNIAFSETPIGTVKKVTGLPLTNNTELITLYPNPTTNQFSIDLKDLEGIPQMLIVNDEQGNMIFQKTVDATCCNNVQVNFPKSGIYTVLIQTNQGIVTKKIAVSQ